MTSYKQLNDTELQAWLCDARTFLDELHQLNVTTWDDMPDIFFRHLPILNYIVRARDIAANPRYFKPTQCINLIISHLQDALAHCGATAATTPSTTPTPATTTPATTTHAGSQPTATHAAIHPSATHASSPSGQPAFHAGSNPTPTHAGTQPTDATYRGTHISDYAYMLPDSVRALSEQLPNLYLEQSEWSGRSDILASSYQLAEKKGNTEEMADISKHLSEANKELVKVNQRIREIYDIIDDCVAYFQAHGGVMPMTPEAKKTTPAPAQSHRDTEASSNLPIDTSTPRNIDNSTPPQSESSAIKPSDMTKAYIDTIEDPAIQHHYAVMRQESNKRYLRRTDVKKTDEWREQVRLRAQELLDWDIRISKKVRTLLEANGIVLE